MSTRIITCNVNGIRAAFRKGMGEWLEQSGADFVLLQEVRANDQILNDLIPEGWHVYAAESELKGRAGVAILARTQALEVRNGMGHEEETGSHTGRWLEADFEVAGQTLTLVSAYLHSGQVDTPKMDAKYQHLDWVDARLAQLRKQPWALVCGDFNIVHTELDIKNWKGNHNKTAGVLDEEIAHVDAWLEAGWVDVQRQLVGPETQGPYTWWSQRGKAFDNDAGWRIDYQLATPELAELAQEFMVDRAESYDARWSDHAPVFVDYEL
ncbi:exodeoxyribonuclease III [Boudabousia liubingyangii]|uniref:exodeoxyribonuclease III n=1 Tax=Boudabousia liubingyangii TaxID=1921764 RepID=UPI00093F7BC5|nr:exodeoxyribonuclease III [Boudabousia liubingyangii]OKL46308.1 exodeoxyribonuclease III [Boudabousia liubingyangii]